MLQGTRLSALRPFWEHRHAWSPALPQLSLDGAAEGTAGGNREHQKGAVRYMLRAFGNTGRAQAAWRKRQCQ